MKKRMFEKLHSEHGASISFALILLLVASLVSVVILNAAVSAAKSVTNDRMEQQALLTLNSAAKIVEKGLSDTKYTATVVTHVYDGSYTVTDTPSILEDATTSVYAMHDVFYAAIQTIANNQVATYSSSTGGDIVLNLNISDEDVADTMLLGDGDTEIVISYTLSPDSEAVVLSGNGTNYYDLVMNFSLEDTDGNDYHVALSGVCKLEQTTSSSTVASSLAGYSTDVQTTATEKFSFSGIRLLAY